MKILKVSNRTGSHKRITEVEDILKELSGLISDPIDKKFNSGHPIFFIMGCARSGTTLVSQYLADTGSFCYPSNFISRFFYAPYVGSLLQKLTFDLDFKGELFGGYQGKTIYKSDLGKTKGPLAPHEFWYFWRRYFKFGELQQLTEPELARIDTDGFLNGLRGIQHVFEKPLFLKGMIANWHIPFLAEIVPNSYFIYVKRDLLYNAQSLLKARESFFSDIRQWYSFKPAEYIELKSKDPYHQVAGQVFYTNEAIENGLELIGDERAIEVQYEDFCEKPTILLNAINEKTGIQAKSDADSFTLRKEKQLEDHEWEILEKATGQYEE